MTITGDWVGDGLILPTFSCTTCLLLLVFTAFPTYSYGAHHSYFVMTTFSDSTFCIPLPLNFILLQYLGGGADRRTGGL